MKKVPFPLIRMQVQKVFLKDECRVKILSICKFDVLFFLCAVILCC
jgi:hypothetical protein